VREDWTIGKMIKVTGQIKAFSVIRPSKIMKEAR
jgi:hypothetical protein